MTLTLDTIQGWSADDLQQQLSASPEATAAILKVAAEGGVIDAQALYGQALLDGNGTPANPTEALHWFTTAAKAGHLMATNMVGRCCELGWGTPVDKTLAAEWYEAAAKRGLDWAMYNLATLLALGDGVAMDRAEALKLYRAAAARGHVKSESMIGGFYEDGWVVNRDLTKAATHYRRGAEGGDFRAMFNHARMLIDAGDLTGAQQWITALADHATPAFLAKAHAWLRGHPRAEVAAMVGQNAP